MADYAAEWTDEKIAALEGRIKGIFSDSLSDIEKKTAEFWRKYAVKDKIHRKELEEGKISKETYRDWVAGQVFQGEQWQAQKERIIKDISNADKIAMSIVHKTQDEVFTTNANYMSYAIESDLGGNYGFGVLDKNTLKLLLEDDPQLLPRKYIKNEENERYVSTCIDKYTAQGIIQGESVEDVAKRIVQGVPNTIMRYALVNARTSITCAQNAGRMLSLREANEELGLDVDKEWSSSGDERVRESHREINGEVVPYDKPFSNGLMYPADPHGKPAEVYNCRCTMYENVRGLKKGALSAAKSEKSYKDWLKAKTQKNGK